MIIIKKMKAGGLLPNQPIILIYERTLLFKL